MDTDLLETGPWQIGMKVLKLFENIILIHQFSQDISFLLLLPPPPTYDRASRLLYLMLSSVI